MNDGQLDRLLRSNHPPERTADYWNSFPEAVRSQLRPAGSARPASASHRRSAYWLALRWLAAGGTVALLSLLLSWQRTKPAGQPEFTAAELQSYREIWRQISTLFPHQVRAVILGPDGPQVVLSDRPNLPSAPPVVLRHCASDGCRTALTFSGQAVQLGQRQLEVLTDSRDGVIVAAEDGVWPLAKGPFQLSARILESTL